MNNELIAYYATGIFTTCLSASIAYGISLRFQKSVPSWLLYTLVVFSGYMFIAQYLKLQSLHMYVDVAHWGQIVHNIATKWVPESLDHEFVFPGTRNYFSVHFVPFIFIFAFLYRLAPSLETVLFTNGIFMILSGIPLYLLVKRLSQNTNFALFFVVLLFWYPTFQYITLYEFEMLRFSIPLLLCMIYFWEQKRLRLYFLFVFLTTLVREEVGLIIFMFGLYVAFVEKKKMLGLITSAIGLGSFFTIISFVIPAFHQSPSVGYLPFSLFSKFGTTPWEIFWGIMTHPVLIFKTVFNIAKLANIGMLFVPLLGLPLLAPEVLFVILGNIGINMLSESITNTSYMLYYISPSIPFIFYSLVKAWPKFVNMLSNRLPFRRFNKSRDSIVSAAMWAVLSAVFVSNIFFGPSPFSLQFWSKNLKPAPFRTQDFHWSVYRVTDHHRKADEFVRLIPDEAIVSAPQFLFPRLYRKRGTLVFPEFQSADGSISAEYVIIDRTNNGLNNNSPAYVSEEQIDQVAKNKMWEFVKAEDGYELYRRKYAQ